MKTRFTSLIAASALLLGGGIASAADTAARQAPGFYRASLGQFEVLVLSDGTAPRKLEELLSDPALVRRELALAHESDPVELSINSFLIRTKEHVVLIDTGAGELFGPTSGKLVENMRAAGYAPEQVDTILLTHIHGDHSGGLSIGGKPVFPNATVYVSARDLAYWLDGQAEQAAAPTARRSFEQSRATVNPYVDAKRVRTVADGAEVVPGIRALAAAGHTPGHLNYMVESAGHKLLLWGDTVHAAEVQLEHPEVTIKYDVSAPGAAESRKKLLKSIAADGLAVGAAHLSFPGLGHLRIRGDGYQWMPIPYAANVAELDTAKRP